MNPDIEQRIKEAAQIADVVGRYIDLKRDGSGFKARCPFHNDHTPSFKVKPAKGIYKCFGCDVGGDAISFVMGYTKCTYPEALETIAGIYGIPTQSGTFVATWKAPQPPKYTPQQQPIQEPTYIPKNIFRQSLRDFNKNHFVSFLIGKFEHETTAALIERYLIGTSDKWPGANVFWYLDSAGHVRTGKVMQYNSATGKRDRGINPNWVHSILKIKDTALCWYGEHLLRKYPTAPVGIVESEKTAIIASVYLPDTIWLAAGGKSLAIEKWPPLEGRKVMLFPDADPTDEKGNSPFVFWSNEAERLSKYGYLVQVSDLFEHKATAKQRAAKMDLADYLLQFAPSDFHTLSKPQTNA